MTKLLPTLLLLLLAGSLAATTLGEKRDAAVRLQIYLDQKLFGPGFIDGKPGAFTKRAIAAYNETLGRGEEDLEELQAEADSQIEHTYVTAVVPNVARNFVNPKLPYKREEQAKEKKLIYRSYLEFMAERYHTSEDVLIELNGRKKAWGARPKKTLLVPNVEPFQIENLVPGRMHKDDEQELSMRRVVIDTKEKQVRIYRPLEVSLASTTGAATVSTPPAYELVASFPTTPGREKFIHRGVWTLRNMIEWPVWRYDKQMLEKGKRGKEALNIPGGPNNPVGVMWCGLSKSGIGIHGTDSPRTIGRARSSGCYRLANWDVVRLTQLVRPGAIVEVK